MDQPRVAFAAVVITVLVVSYEKQLGLSQVGYEKTFRRKDLFKAPP